MNIVELIIKKRDGYQLTQSEIEFFVSGTVNESIEKYQVSAMLMAMYLKGLSDTETAYLTMAMVYSGTTFDLSDVPGIKVDKHSTGGVADTTTLVLAPLVASLGVPVIKMSGRALGHTGGTLDKLESIPGFRVDISEAEALSFAKGSNITILGQTKTLTPADKKLYSLRDVTGTVDNISLIAASIMSKKIAAGADAIVLDVKCGSGAFMRTYAEAKKLATAMVSIGESVGRRVVAVISSMEQPLGLNIGNALEVIEAIEVLKGNIKGDLLDVTELLGAEMLILAKRAESIDEAKSMLRGNIVNGKAIAKFRELIAQQGGDSRIVDDYSLLPAATTKKSLTAAKEGYIYSMNCADVGLAAGETGMSRHIETDSVDYGAGITMKKRLGDFVKKGDVIADIFSSTIERCNRAAERLDKAIAIKNEKPERLKLVMDIVKS